MQPHPFRELLLLGSGRIGINRGRGRQAQRLGDAASHKPQFSHPRGKQFVGDDDENC